MQSMAVEENLERRYRSEPLPPMEPNKQSKIEADWLGWGDFVTLAVANEDDAPDAHWNAFFRLAKIDGDFSSTFVDFDKLLAGDLEDGTSNFTIDPSMKDPRLSITGIPVPFILKRSVDDHLGGIEIEAIKANNSYDALNLALAYFSLASAYLSLAINLPLRYKAARVRRADGTVWRLRVYHPWPEAQLQSLSFQIPAIPVAGRLITMYAEGVNTNSAAYRFLCFYKVVDHIIHRAGALRTHWASNYPTATWHELNGTLPEKPIDRFDLDLVGKQYTEVRKRYMETELRNAVAHVINTEATFEPLDPEHASHYRAAGAVCRFIAQHLIRLVAINCQAMLDQGATVADLNKVLYPETRAKR